MLRQVEFTLPVVVWYDDVHTDKQGAVDEFNRALNDAEDTGVFERQLIDFTYGDPQDVTDEPAPPDTMTSVGSKEGEDD